MWGIGSRPRSARGVCRTPRRRFGAQRAVAHVGAAIPRSTTRSPGRCPTRAGSEPASDDRFLVFTLVVCEGRRIEHQCIDSVLGLEIPGRDGLADHRAARLLADGVRDPRNADSAEQPDGEDPFSPAVRSRWFSGVSVLSPTQYWVGGRPRLSPAAFRISQSPVAAGGSGAGRGRRRVAAGRSCSRGCPALRR